MVRVLGNGQVMRSPKQDAPADTQQHSFSHHRSRHHRHTSLAAARDSETRDRELESQVEQLQTSLQTRLRSIRRREETLAADAQYAQQRTESLNEREHQVVEKEVTMKQQADQVAEQHAVVQQLQSELLNQYNTVVASLPRLEDRLQAARHMLPDCTAPATSLWKDPSNVAEAGLSSAPCQSQQQPITSLPAQKGTCDQPLDAHRTAKHKVDNSYTAALPGVSGDASRGDAKDDNQATSQETDGPPFSIHAGARQTNAAPATEVPPMAETLPETASGQHLPHAAKQRGCFSLGEGDSRPDSQRAGFGLQPGHTVQPLSLAASRQELDPALPQLRCAANIASRGAGTSCQSDPALLQQQIVTPVLSSLDQPVASQQQPSMVSSELRPVHVVSKGNVPGGHSRKSAAKLTTSDARPEQAGADVAQTRKRTSRQTASAAQVLGSAGAPGMTKPRPGLRSQADSAASSDKAGMAALGRPECAHRKQASAERNRSGQDMVLNSSTRGTGRGRGFGRGGRRGRARSALFRTSCSETQPAGDLDEAVQALKATAEGKMPAVCSAGGASVLEDDELKPSFMRRVSSDRSPPAKEPAARDPNPRPVTRRRTEASRNTQPAKAKAAMQEEVPDLLEILQQKGLAEHVDLLDLCDPSAPDSVYSEMHSILSRLCEGKMGSWQGRNVTGKGVVLEGEEGGKHEYCLLALEHLLERAEAYSLNSESVRWGWCRELSSFVFVFEVANRIVVEKPCYGHATYFFDLEEPLPVSSQVQRLIAVLSVPGVSRRKLLEDSSLDPGPELTAQERKQLEAAGWRPGTTIRSLLNFTGDRIFHQSAEIMTGQKLMQRDAPDYKYKIAKVLSEGASGGRVTKCLQ